MTEAMSRIEDVDMAEEICYTQRMFNSSRNSNDVSSKCRQHRQSYPYFKAKERILIKTIVEFKKGRLISVNNKLAKNIQVGLYRHQQLN